MTSREALYELCDNCECHLMLSHKVCKYKRLSHDHCDEYKKVKKDLEVLEILRRSYNEQK